MWEPHQLCALPPALLVWLYRHYRHHHRRAGVCPARCCCLQNRHELGVLPRIPPGPGGGRRGSGRAGALSLCAQMVPGTGLYRPAVLFYGGCLFMLPPLCDPRFPPPLAGGSWGRCAPVSAFWLTPKVWRRSPSCGWACFCWAAGAARNLCRGAPGRWVLLGGCAVCGGAFLRLGAAGLRV